MATRQFCVVCRAIDPDLLFSVVPWEHPPFDHCTAFCRCCRISLHREAAYRGQLVVSAPANRERKALHASCRSWNLLGSLIFTVLRIGLSCHVGRDKHDHVMCRFPNRVRMYLVVFAEAKTRGALGRWAGASHADALLVVVMSPSARSLAWCSVYSRAASACQPALEMRLPTEAKAPRGGSISVIQA